MIAARIIVCVWACYFAWRLGTMIAAAKRVCECCEPEIKALHYQGIGAIIWFTGTAFFAGYALYAAIH